jgi:two-component system LytT family response regulator
MSGPPWRALVVDDEPPARQTLKVLLARESDFVLAAECAHGAEAAERIPAVDPHVIFLDVEMPGIGAFDLLRLLDGTPPALIVFVTAHARYALQAFEQHAFDYLLKPFSDERFADVADRIRTRLRERQQARIADRLGGFLVDPSPSGGRRTLVVRDGTRTVVIPHDEILWIEAEDYCVRIHLAARTLLVRETLHRLAARLDADGFVRVHRSAIANVGAVRSLEPATSGDGRVTLADGTTLRVSRTRRRDVVGALARRAKDP